MYPSPIPWSSLSRSLAGNASASVDAPADGGDAPPGSVTETLKLLKRLGYPESQEIYKSSALLTKVNAALTKRMGKLEAAKQSLSVPGVVESQLSKKKLG